MSDSTLIANAEETSVGQLVELLQGWRTELQRISDEDLATAQGFVGEALEDEESGDRYASVGDVLKALSRETTRLADGTARLSLQFDVLEIAWHRTHRYSPAGVEALGDDLLRRAQRRPGRAARRWLMEVLKAIEQRDNEGAARVAAIELPFSGELEPLQDGAREIRFALEAAADGDRDALIRLIVSVAEAKVAGWTSEQLDEELCSTAHRLASWLSVEMRGDIETAREHVGQAIKLQPHDARAYIERSALHRKAGESDLAAQDAQRVLELEPEAAAGFVALGSCAEDAGDFDQADHLYGEALNRLASWDVTTLRGDSLIDGPSSHMLVLAAQRMLGVHRPRAALSLIDLALRDVVLGPGDYPEAEAYRVRADALEELESVEHEDVAAAALEAGRRYLWDERLDTAIEQLRRAVRYSSGSDASGWLLADALVRTQRVGSPDPVIAKQALDTWTEWRERAGPPEGTMAWAYVTRALIAEDLQRPPEIDPEERWWDALSYVERALVEDDADAIRWVLRARYTRALGLLNIAGEALERAATREPDLIEVQAERMALLGTLDRLEDADRAVVALTERIGPHEALSAARAYIAHRQKRDGDAISLLEGVLGEDSAPDYNALLAVCHLANGDLSAARRNYGAVLEQHSAASPELLRLATFAVDPARIVGEDREPGQTTDGPDGLAVEALIAYARHERDRGSELLEESVRTARTVGDLHERECDFPLQLKLVPDDEARRAGAEAAFEVLRRAVAERHAELTSPDLTADGELAQAQDRADVLRADGGATVAPDVARAVRAHRLQDQGQLELAASTYEELMSTPFERMACIALGRVLERRSKELAAAQDIEALEEVQARRLALGATSPVDSMLEIARILVALGRAKEAQDRLRNALDVPAETVEDRERLLQALGEAAMVHGDLTLARATLEEAVAIAEREHRDARAAQQYVRLGLLEFLSGHVLLARANVSQALRAWKRAGAFVPQWLLVQEVQQLARGMLPLTVRRWLKPLLIAGGVEEQALLEAGPPVESDHDDSGPS